jgi:hypothetical protein
MTSPVVVRSASGVLFEMDVPAADHARELWDHKIAKGDLVIVNDPVMWVDAGDGARVLQLAPTASPEAPSVAPDAPRRGRPPKVQALPESAVEASEST